MTENEDDLMDEFETVTLTDEDGCDIEFAIIDTLENGGNTYILAVEADRLDDDESEAALFKKAKSEDGEDIFEIIEDDDEFDKIAELFQSSGSEYDVEIDE